MRRLLWITFLLTGAVAAQSTNPVPVPLPPGPPYLPPPSGGSSGGSGSTSGGVNSSVIRTNGGFLAYSIPANDDGSAPRESLGFTINFFGKQRSAVFVNNNGNITFDNALATYTPFGLTGTEREIIAPFFADVDTRAGSRLVTYGRDTVDGHLAFGANYINVGYYNQHTDKLNSFQVVVIDRSDLGAGDFDVEFNYGGITWETGDASSGVNGLGGSSASVGWSNGTGLEGTYFELDGTLVPGAFLDSGPDALIRQKIDSTATGRLVFHARDGVLLPPLSITTSCPLPGAALGQPYTLQFHGVGGSQPYTWNLIPDPGSSLTPGLTFTSDGKLSGTPTSGGSWGFTVQLSSNTDAGQQTVSNVCSLNVIAPTLTVTTSCPLPQATVGSAYAQSMTVTGGRAPFTWSVDAGSLPPGLSLTTDGLLAGTPTTPGTYSFQLLASSNPADGAQPTTRGCSVTVKALPVDLSANTDLPAGTVGVPYSRDLTVQGGTPPYRWSTVGSMPPGMSLAPEGRLTGTVSTAGVYSFNVRAADSAGNQSVVHLSLVIANPVISITDTCPLPAGTSGSAYSHQMSASGGTPPYTWSLLGGLQAGLTLSPDGLLAGNAQGAGSVGFRALVTDSAGNSATRSCTLPVVRSGFSLTGCPLAPATLGTPYTRYISAIGGTPPYIYTSGSALPDGFALSSYGRVSGTATQPGSYTLDLQVTDSTGRTLTQPCTLPVNASQLIIQSGCPLPEAHVGTAYSATLQATGGIPPYTYTAVSGVPPGLTISPDGSVSGTPTTTGVYQTRIRLTDSQQNALVETCAAPVVLGTLPSLHIAELPSTEPPASTGPTVTVALDSAYTLPVQGQLNLIVTPETGTSDGSVNRADPRVKFTNGQPTASFTLEPGSLSYSIGISSTGTVASSVVASISNLKVGSSPVVAVPTPQGFQVPRSVPVITSGCYATGTDSVTATITGYTTTRQLYTAAFTFGDQQKSVDVSASAAAYFSTDDSVRNGGAFTLTVPFTLQNTGVEQLSVTLSNSEGVSASANLNRCQ
jgi:hypothetical protein